MSTFGLSSVRALLFHRGVHATGIWLNVCSLLYRCVIGPGLAGNVKLCLFTREF